MKQFGIGVENQNLEPRNFYEKITRVMPIDILLMIKCNVEKRNVFISFQF
jgi:hypothetical protein